jgi:hypothetical protein
VAGRSAIFRRVIKPMVSLSTQTFGVAPRDVIRITSNGSRRMMCVSPAAHG